MRLSLAETKKYGSLCPVCRKPLTSGVLSRVEKLADREEGFLPKNAIPFKSLVPLIEIIADVLERGVGAKEVENIYQGLIDKFGTEFNILLEIPQKELELAIAPEIAEGIIRAREGRVEKEPGYDGVYGKIKIFPKGEEKKRNKQTTLF